VLARQPDDAELKQLRAILKDARVRYAGDAKAARAVAGSRTLPSGVRAPGWAAWFNVAHVLLNLDETITKP
jgi:hypothetical protein